MQVRKVIWKLFELMPTPEAAVAANVDDIRRIIEPLGLIKRAPMLQRFSQEYMEKQVGTSPTLLRSSQSLMRPVTGFAR